MNFYLFIFIKYVTFDILQKELLGMLNSIKKLKIKKSQVIFILINLFKLSLYIFHVVDLPSQNVHDKC